MTVWMVLHFGLLFVDKNIKFNLFEKDISTF